MENQGTIKDPKLALAYCLQPRKNTVTFASSKTGARFTFQIKPLDNEQAKKSIKGMRFFVKFLSGQNNETDYRYLGQILDGVFSLTKKSRDAGLSEKTPAYVAFKSSFDALVAGRMPESLEVVHSGRCARCGRKLTVPASVRDGFGPECINFVSSIAPCPVPEIQPVALPKVNGTPAQPKLDFSPRAELKKQLEEAVKVSGSPVPDIDTEIRRRVAEYKADAPENYYQDGELSEREAFNVAYNKFRVELQKEAR